MVDYRQQLGAAAVVVSDPRGTILARAGLDARTATALVSLPAAVRARDGAERSGFLARGDAVYFVVTAPVWIDPSQPELRTSSVAAALDVALPPRACAPSRAATSRSRGRARCEPRRAPPPRPRRSTRGLLHQATPTVSLGAEEFMVRVMPLHAAATATAGAGTVPGVVLLRSRTEHLRFLATLHRALAATALAAVLLATVLCMLSRARSPGRSARSPPRRRTGAHRTPAPPALPPTSPFDDEVLWAGPDVHVDDDGHRPLPARGHAARTALVARVPVDGDRARNPQPPD